MGKLAGSCEGFIMTERSLLFQACMHARSSIACSAGVNIPESEY